MGCNNSKGSRPEQRGPRIQPPAGRSVPPPQSLIRVKLVLLGATGVGKSCLVLRYVKGLFEAASRVTVGAAFLAHSVSLPDGRTVKFEIWDTAGQERYASLAPLYYRGAGAAVVMYDITSAETFTKAKYWVTELQKNAPDNLVIVLAGNKSDLAEARQVSTEDGQAYAASNAMMFLETSAKTAANVAAVFDAIARQLAGAGAPPSGPSIPTLQNAPPPIATRPTSKAHDRSPPSSSTAASTKQQQQEKGASLEASQNPAAAAVAASAASAGKEAKSTAAAGEEAGQEAVAAAKQESASPASAPASGEGDKGSATQEQKLQGLKESLSSTQSAASIASDGTGNDALPPSTDANILEPSPMSSQPPITPGTDRGKQGAPGTSSGDQPVSKEHHADDGTAGEAASLGAAQTSLEADVDLPAAPQKAEARAAVPATSGEAEDKDAAADDKPGEPSGEKSRAADDTATTAASQPQSRDSAVDQPAASGSSGPPQQAAKGKKPAAEPQKPKPAKTDDSNPESDDVPPKT